MLSQFHSPAFYCPTRAHYHNYTHNRDNNNYTHGVATLSITFNDITTCKCTYTHTVTFTDLLLFHPRSLTTTCTATKYTHKPDAAPARSLTAACTKTCTHNTLTAATSFPLSTTNSLLHSHHLRSFIFHGRLLFDAVRHATRCGSNSAGRN